MVPVLSPTRNMCRAAAGKRSVCGERACQALPPEHLVPGGIEPPLEHGVGGGVPRDLERLRERDPGSDHRAQDPAEALEDGGADEVAQNRDAEDQDVPRGAALSG